MGSMIDDNNKRTLQNKSSVTNLSTSYFFIQTLHVHSECL